MWSEFECSNVSPIPQMKKTVFIIMFLIAATAASAQMMLTDQDPQYVPVPRLLYPASDEVVIEEGKPLVFKWSPHEKLSASGRYYDFRLYDGYDMVQSNLIFKKRLDGDVSQYHMESGMFKEGRVYTWSLRQGYSGIGKSRRSVQSFRVVKGG